MYIPSDLEDAAKTLVIELSPEYLQTIKKCSNEESLSKFHHPLGRFIRNNWELWQESPMSLYFNTIGIYHADDMSAIIIAALWHKLNNTEYDLEGHVTIYQAYWRKVLG